MKAVKPTRAARVEDVIQGMLGLVLLGAVVWALASGNGDSQVFDFANLTRW